MNNGRNVYDQPINDSIKQYDEVRKVSTVSSINDYTTGDDYYKLIAVDLSKQKALVADPRAFEQIVFQVVVGGDGNTKIRLYAILEQSKEIVTKKQQKFCN